MQTLNPGEGLGRFNNVMSYFLATLSRPVSPQATFVSVKTLLAFCELFGPHTFLTVSSRISSASANCFGPSTLSGLPVNRSNLTRRPLPNPTAQIAPLPIGGRNRLATRTPPRGERKWPRKMIFFSAEASTALQLALTEAQSTLEDPARPPAPHEVTLALLPCPRPGRRRPVNVQQEPVDVAREKSERGPVQTVLHAGHVEALVGGGDGGHQGREILLQGVLLLRDEDARVQREAHVRVAALVGDELLRAHYRLHSALPVPPMEQHVGRQFPVQCALELCVGHVAHLRWLCGCECEQRGDEGEVQWGHFRWFAMLESDAGAVVFKIVLGGAAHRDEFVCLRRACIVPLYTPRIVRRIAWDEKRTLCSTRTR